MIDASLNEVESLAAKAARGAGLAWGLAEETGKAAHWLASCGLDWAPSLLRLLDGHASMQVPVSRSRPLRGREPHVPLSPLLTGCHLADLGRQASDHQLTAVAQPLWLLPFAALTAAAVEAAVVISWDDVSISVWPFGGAVSGDAGRLYAAQAPRIAWVHLPPGGIVATPTHTLARAGRSRIDTAHHAALTRLGARTYVPASAHSRAKGAGAGLVDND